MYEVAFPITIMTAFLLTVVSVVAYEAYWEYREEKTRDNHIKQLTRKAVEIYGDHIPEELENYIKSIKED